MGERLRRITRPKLLRANEGCAGLGDPGARLRTDRSAPRRDEILGGGHLRLRLQDLLIEQLCGTSRPLLLVANGPHGVVDLRVRGLQRLQRHQRASVGAGEHASASVDLGARGGDDRGDPAVGIRQRARGGDVVLEVGDQVRCAALGLGEIGGELVRRLFEQLGLPDGVFGRADRHRGVTALAVGDGGVGGGELLVGEAQPLAGLCGVVCDRREGVGGVGGRERCQPCVGLLEGVCGAPMRIAHSGERLRGILLQASQFVEGLGLVVEAGVGLRAQLDDLLVPGALLLVGIRRLVIEALPEGEGLLKQAPGGRERLDEFRRRLVAELGTREPELLFARLQGVVGLHKRRRRLAFEVGEGHHRGSLRAPGGAFRATVPHHEPDEHHDRHRRGDEEHDDPG